MWDLREKVLEVIHLDVYTLSLVLNSIMVLAAPVWTSRIIQPVHSSDEAARVRHMESNIQGAKGVAADLVRNTTWYSRFQRHFTN